MSTITSNLGLFKYDVNTDANMPFSITEALNNNWDIIDEKCKGGNFDGKLTNCILEVPQNIKYSINDNGRLILEAGSKVYVSTNGTFEPVTLTTDTVEGAGGLWTTGHSRMLLVLYIPDSNTVTTVAWNYVYHQTSVPTTFLAGSALWHDTSNNTLKYTTDSGANWQICSLPILCGKPGETSIGWRGYVTEVFNGFGFFGTYDFVLPGVKSLIPNGRNQDGTLNNIEVVNEIVNLVDVSGRLCRLAFFTGKSLIDWGTINYFEQETPPINFGNSAYWYNTRENLMYRTVDGGSSWLVVQRMYLGTMIKDTNDSFYDCNFKNAVQLADIQDCVRKCGDTMNGTLTIQGAETMRCFVKNTSLSRSDTFSKEYQVGEFGINGNDDNMIGMFDTYTSSNGAVRTRIVAAKDVSGTTKYSIIETIVNSDGSAYGKAPASSVIGSIVTTTGISKATNGYVKLGNGIIIQWGCINSATPNPYTLTFPTAFTSGTSYSIQAMDNTNGEKQSHCGAHSQSSTGCNIGHSTDAIILWWLAIGY